MELDRTWARTRPIVHLDNCYAPFAQWRGSMVGDDVFVLVTTRNSMTSNVRAFVAAEPHRRWHRLVACRCGWDNLADHETRLEVSHKTR